MSPIAQAGAPPRGGGSPRSIGPGPGTGTAAVSVACLHPCLNPALAKQLPRSCVRDRHRERPGPIGSPHGADFGSSPGDGCDRVERHSPTRAEGHGRHALNTESFWRTQHSTSACTTASTDAEVGAGWRTASADDQATPVRRRRRPKRVARQGRHASPALVRD